MRVQIPRLRICCQACRKSCTCVCVCPIACISFVSLLTCHEQCRLSERESVDLVSTSSRTSVATPTASLTPTAARRRRQPVPAVEALYVTFHSYSEKRKKQERERERERERDGMEDKVFLICFTPCCVCSYIQERIIEYFSFTCAFLWFLPSCSL